MAMETAEVKFSYTADISNVLKANRVVARDVDNTLSSIGRSMARQEKFVNSMDYGLTRLSSKLKNVSIPFAGWAMSLMFAGMALQRMATTIWKFGVKAFDDISHSVEGTVTANDMLQGSMKYLGYVVGEALQPLLAYLVPIVDNISEWISENPKLVATLTGAAGLAGAVLSVGGAFKLAKNGAKEFIILLQTTNWAEIGLGIQKGIGVIAIVYSVMAAADAFASLSEGKFGKAFLEALSSGLMGYGGIMLFKNAKAGAPLVVIGYGLKLVAEGKFLQTITSIFGLLFAYIETWTESIMNNFKNGIISGLVGTLIDILKIMTPLGLIPGANEALNKLKDYANIDRFSFGEEFASNYKQGMANAREGDRVINYYIDKLSIETDNLEQMDASIRQNTTG